MKRIFLSTMFVVIALTIMAVPVKRGVWKTVKLADGREVKVQMRGDEYLSFWQAEDGSCYVKTVGKNYFVAADMESLSKVAMEKRLANPLPYHQAVEIASQQSRVSIGGEHPDFIGSKKGLIILAEFTDQKFQPGHDTEYYKHLANDLNFSHPDGHVGSIRDYFLAQSEGKFDLTFDVFGPVQLAHDMKYYGEPTDWGNDKNVSAMIKECVQAAANELGTFEPYDWFNDGNVDQVFVLYAGVGEAEQDADPNSIWPHRSAIARTRLGGKYVSTYACANEVNLNGKVDGIGTFCHEFSHCLGLADLYDINYGEYNDGVEFYGMVHWDIMDGGCYLSDGYSPCGYSGFEKNYCGWKTPIILTEDTEVTNLKGMSEGGDYYIIYNDAHKDEYYVLENRSRTGWDAGQYGSGLLITHVDFKKNVWAMNCPNSVYPGVNDHPRYTLFLADNNERMQYVSDIAGDVYPYKTNNMLTNYSVPAATLYNNNIDGIKYMSKPITDITKNADGTVSFKFTNEVGKSQENLLPEGIYFKETFDNCAGTGGNDGKWGSSAVLSTMLFDNLGWDLPTGGGANQCIAIGTTDSNDAATATTPEFSIDAPSVVSFKAGIARVNSSTEISVNVTEGTATLSQTLFQNMAKETWNEYSVKLAALQYPAKVRLTFSNGKRRTFIDEIVVGSEDALSGIDNVVSDKFNAIKSVYTIDGRYAGKDINLLAPGIYIVNGKKVVK